MGDSGTARRAKAQKFLEWRKAKQEAEVKPQDEKVEAVKASVEKAEARTKARKPLGTSKEEALRVYVARLLDETKDRREAYDRLSEAERVEVIPPPPLPALGMVRKLREAGMSGHRTGRDGPRSLTLVNLRIQALMLTCYRYELALLVVAEKLKPDFGWLYETFRLYGTDEEFAYFRWFSRNRWDVITAELKARHIGVHRPEGEEWCNAQNHYSFICLAEESHPDWPTYMRHVLNNKTGCPACGHKRRGLKRRKRKGP